MKKHPFSLQYIKGIGPKRVGILEKYQIRTIEDLLLYFPYGYLDRSQVVRISDLSKYIKSFKPVTIFAEVYGQEAKRSRRRNKIIFYLTVRDESGFLTCVWFEGFQWLKDKFEVGELLALSAVPTYDKYYRPQFVHPQYDRLKKSEEDEIDWGKLFNTGGIIPKYKSTAELEKVGLDSRGFRRIIRNAINDYIDIIDESLPQGILNNQNLYNLKEAIYSIHFPRNFKDLEQAQKRLKFEELFFLQLMFAIRKRNLKTLSRGFVYNVKSTLARQLVNSLNFELTSAQKRVLKEIITDMQSPVPMNRLLQGDVGSGKTIVALCIALIAVENGLQVAFMAPTEILAEQHYRTIISLLKVLNVNVRLLIGGQSKKLRADILEDIRSGNAQIIVGTHALIDEKVEFAKLGLIIIDEQHRFGVMQRGNLCSKGVNPDTLIMTATPIPRTLAMTVYGDLDFSVIDEMPADRKPIVTVLRTEQEKERVYKFVNEEIKQGRQAYIVFPLIEESEKIDLKAAEKEYEYLKEKVFTDCTVGLLHGKMKTELKDDVMQKFKSGEINILVSTTVIEVGIDIPNATIMIVHNAERFGLSQLHQLRGRVGRGAEQSYCILIANYNWYNKMAKLKDEYEVQQEKQKASIRLETMVKTTDGFEIAEVDLKLRGPGEFFGTKQSGIPELRIANLINDSNLILIARQEANDIIEKDPHLRNPANERMKKHFEKKYKHLLELGKIS